MGRPKAASLGHCIKSCILYKFEDCEKPSVGADARGNPTSDNKGLCQLNMYRVYNLFGKEKRKADSFSHK
jgi:hypothetical protein